MLQVALAAALQSAPTVMRDLSGIGGAALIAYGAWMIFPPAGFITGGALLLTGAMLSSARTA